MTQQRLMTASADAADTSVLVEYPLGRQLTLDEMEQVSAGRRNEEATAQLARNLIDLAAYGSTSLLGRLDFLAQAHNVMTNGVWE